MARTAKRSDPEGRMTLVEHLRELRRRIVICAISIVAAMVVGWFTAPWVWDQLRAPILAIAQQGSRDAQINYPDITSAFDLNLQIAFTVGLVVSSPIWLYQIWAFLGPGLTGKEKRYALGFICSAIPLFLAGCYAGWAVFPHIVQLMTGFAPQQDAALIEARSYLDFVLKLVIVIGVAFVVPVFLVLLDFAGIISAHSIIRSWRVALLAIVLFTAIATPSADVLSMFLLAIPMVVLYFAAAGIAWLHDRRAAKRQEALYDEPAGVPEDVA